jgi:hypothetical protein
MLRFEKNVAEAFFEMPTIELKGPTLILLTCAFERLLKLCSKCFVACFEHCGQCALFSNKKNHYSLPLGRRHMEWNGKKTLQRSPSPGVSDRTEKVDLRLSATTHSESVSASYFEVAADKSNINYR